MNKRAVMSYVVAAILVLAAAAVLIPLTGIIIKVIRSSGTEAACTASAQLSSRTMVAGVETISLNCPMTLVDVTMDDLRAETKKARDQIIKIKKNEEIKIKYFKNEYNITRLHEFVLNKKIAEEMRKCWQKLGEGELELFNAWYNKLEDEAWKKWLPTLDRPPITCIICSRIRFDGEIKKQFSKINSLDEWLKISTVQGKGITYYDYLLDEVHDQILFTPEWSYITQQPVAVVFARMNPKQSKGILLNLLAAITPLGKEQPAIDVLYLIEYGKAGEYCDYLANKPPED